MTTTTTRGTEAEPVAATVAPEAAAGGRAERLTHAIALAAIACVVCAIVAQLVPGSPWYALRAGDNVGRGMFGQRWNLFAPRPPSANLATHVVVAYTDGDVQRSTAPFDLSTAVRAAQVRSRLAPPRLARVVTRFNVAFERNPEWPSAADIEGYSRLLSSVAPALAPDGAPISAVRGIVVRTWTKQPADRGDMAALEQEQIFDSGWLRYDVSVEPFDVVDT